MRMRRAWPTRSTSRRAPRRPIRCRFGPTASAPSGRSPADDRTGVAGRVRLEAADQDLDTELEPLVVAAAEQQIDGALRPGEAVVRQRRDVVAEHLDDLVRRQVLAGGGGDPEALLERERTDVE